LHDCGQRSLRPGLLFLGNALTEVGAAKFWIEPDGPIEVSDRSVQIALLYFDISAVDVKAGFFRQISLRILGN
jgi:hypothetical protein